MKSLSNSWDSGKNLDRELREQPLSRVYYGPLILEGWDSLSREGVQKELMAT